MYAVIQAGGKQFRVAPGDKIKVETIGAEVGAQIELNRVLAVMRDSNELVTGADLGQARVTATVASHGRGDKVVVFKFKRKKQYKRTIGHRQNYTELRIDEINA